MATEDGTTQVQEALWICRTEGCDFVGTSDEVLDHVADPATGPGHRAFDRVGK
jgi:hypothetical protein